MELLQFPGTFVAHFAVMQNFLPKLPDLHLILHTPDHIVFIHKNNESHKDHNRNDVFVQEGFDAGVKFFELIHFRVEIPEITGAKVVDFFGIKSARWIKNKTEFRKFPKGFCYICTTQKNNAYAMENYLVSARKYRPDTFQSVVGQSALTTTLKNAIHNKQLAHAYLFCGPRGVGKTTCARIFAKTINCSNPKEDGEACDECESCQSFNDQRSLNIFELDAASNNSVDDIRNLVDQVRIPPQLGQYKVYIIDEVHMLSAAAFNAFLKTLEEPPHHAIFILATTEKHKIIPTILSRCQIYDFNRISVHDIVGQLQHVAQSEKVEAEEEALNIIAMKADGGMRDALSIFDQVSSFGNGKITYQNVIDNLNVLDYDYYFKLTDAFLKGDLSSALLLFNDVLNNGFEGQHFITGLSAHFRDLLVCKDPATLVLLEVGASIRANYQEQAAQCPAEFLYTAIKISNDCDLDYKESKNKRLLIELALIRITQLSDSKKKISELILDEAPISILPLQATATPEATSPTLSKPAATSSPTTDDDEKADAQVPASPVKKNAVKTESNASAPAPNQKDVNAPRSIRSVQTASLHKKAEVKEENVSQEEDVLVLNQPFTAEALVRSWNIFIDTIRDDMHLINAMKACPPVLLEDYQFEVVVQNQVQEKKFQELIYKIEKHLHKNLKNNKIKMTIRMADVGENVRPFTARDRLECMIKKNPNLELLYRTFGLDIS
jgi:DNA polymerase III subunit gamma/tau